MKAQFTTINRKDLVKAIAEITESKPKYLAAPTFAYEVGEFRVNKDGSVEGNNPETLELLIESLAFRGILTKEAEMAESEADGLCIYIPKEKLTENAVENLKRAAEARQELFKRVFGGDIRILEEEDRVGFPWFPVPNDAAETNAYTQFVESLCNMARVQKRVNLRHHPVENEKYEFRCFLLGLGFIGDKYKEARKILLKDLEGSAAFKNK